MPEFYFFIISRCFGIRIMKKIDFRVQNPLKSEIKTILFMNYFGV